MSMQSINASVSPEVQMNENFETLEHQSVYGKRHPVTTGLTWGYYGGRWGGLAVSDGTVTLTDASTNYLVVERATGALTSSTGTTNWTNTTDYARVYQLTTSGGVVTAVQDHRAGPNGVHGGGAGGASPSGTVGRHSIPVLAAAMRPRVTGGCAALATVELTAGRPDSVSLDFDPTVQEYAQFMVLFPKSWDRGAVTFQPIWSHTSGGTAFDVIFSLAGVHVPDDGAINSSFGTPQYSQTTGGTANDLYIGQESPAITIAGSPSSAAVIPVYFEVSRVVGDNSDDMDIDARLHGIMLHIETAAETDA